MKIFRPFGVWRCKFSPLERSWRRFCSLGGVFEALEAISSLEVHKCWIGALWRCKFQLWRVLGGAFGALEEFIKNLEAISSLEVHKGWIGALWRYFEALDVHVSTFQHCKS